MTIKLIVAGALIAFFGLLASPAVADHANNDTDLDVEHSSNELPWADSIPMANLYWSTDWDGTAGHDEIPRSAIDDALQEVIDAGYFDALDEYDVPEVELVASIQTRANDNLCVDTPGAQISTADLLIFVECELLLHPQAPETPRIINLFIPAGTTIFDGIQFEFEGVQIDISRTSCEDYGAYHAFSATAFISIIPVECGSSFSGVMSSLTHEVVETATDPVPLAYWIDSGLVSDDIFEWLTNVPGLLAAAPQLLVDGEIADICERTFEHNGVTASFRQVPLDSSEGAPGVGSYWANDENACVVGDGPENRVVAAFFDRAEGDPDGVGSVIVDGVEHELPYAQMVRVGTTYSFVGNPDDGTGHRWAPSAPCEGAVGFPTGNVTADPSTLIRCEFEEQYFLDVSTLPAGAAAGNASLTESSWRTAGSVVGLDADASVPIADGSRFAFDAWTGVSARTATVTMDRARAVVANYDIEHLVRLTASGVDAGSPWSVEVNGISTNGPAETWVTQGDDVSFDFPSHVPDGTEPGTRYALRSVDETSPLTVLAPTTVTATYGTEHLIDFTATGIGGGTPWSVIVNGAPIAGPTSAWHAEGVQVSFAYPSIIPDVSVAGTRYVRSSLSHTSPLTVLTPSTVDAVYDTEHLLTVAVTGLGSESTALHNDGALLGVISDTAPLALWLLNGTPIALEATDPVGGVDGTQYFLVGFDPAPPSALDGPFETTIEYATMEGLLEAALESGGIASNPPGPGMVESLVAKFDRAQAALSRGSFAGALDPLGSFINQVNAQAGKAIDADLADHLVLDAAAVLHTTLCQAIDAGQIDEVEAAEVQAFYEAVVTAAGGTPLTAC